MKQPIKMTSGDELHLTALMAPFSLNLVTGQDRQHLLGYGRAAFDAGKDSAGKCLHQIQEPEADIWPCVNIDVDESGKITNAKLYSPGLPAGNHDVYPVRVPYMDEHTEAWRACVDELEKAVPGFMSLGNMNGIECAVSAIQGLAERAKHQEPAPVQAAQHPDDEAVDALAALMKAKLAKQRAKGYGGWDTDCTRERLSDLLRGHVDKGDPVDVANFCAFLSARGEGIATQAAPAAAAMHDGWMEKLGFELDAEADGIWQVIEDTGARREATLTERVLWKELTAIRAALAATPVADAQIQSQANAWLACCDALETVKPGFMEKIGTGVECAILAIKELASQQAAAPVVLPEPAFFANMAEMNRAILKDHYFNGGPKKYDDFDTALYTEQQVRALLATGGEAQAAPAFYAALGSNGCALPQYSAGTEEGVIFNVLSVARNEGYKGSGLDRLIELGWVVRPVYTRPAPATANSPATATGLPAQAVAASWKDHHTAQLVNQLRDCATTYGQTQQLRERIATIVAPLCDQLKAHQSVLLPAAPQAQADARDAERYRWLRDISVPPHNFYLSVPDEFKDEKYSPVQVDAAIDAAIAAAKGE